VPSLEKYGWTGNGRWESCANPFTCRGSQFYIKIVLIFVVNL
jgi:hypothetical protein